MKPPEYFPDRELRCHCGCGLLPPPKSVERLYAVRIMLQHPLPISSAARCKKHNKSVGGKQSSIHLPVACRIGKSKEWEGGAFDIIANKDLQAEIFRAGIHAGFTGFGFADNFIHIDDSLRPHFTTWRY